MESLERIALSIGLSLAIIPQIGLFLNYIPWGIRLTPIVTSLATFTETMAVAGVFAILGWIGYTLTTIPPPKPIEEMEKEIEEEMKKLEAESINKQKDKGGS